MRVRISKIIGSGNLASLLFILLNIIFSLVIIFRGEIVFGFLLLSCSCLIAIVCKYTQRKKERILHKLEKRLYNIKQALSYIPFNIMVRDFDNNILFSNCAHLDLESKKYDILDSIDVLKDISKIVKVKINDEIISYFSYRNIIDDYKNNFTIDLELNITNIFKSSYQLDSSNIKGKFDYYRLFNINNDGILIFSYNVVDNKILKYLDSNIKMKEMLGVEDFDDNILDLFHISERDRISAILSKINKESLLFEALMLNKNQSFPVEINANISHINGENVVYFNIRNISIRKYLEDKRDRNRLLLVKQDRSHSILLTLHILITKIYQYTNSIKEQTDKFKALYPSIESDVNSINYSQEKIISTIRDLIAFYSPTDIKSSINIKSLIENIQETMFFKDMVNNIAITIVQKGDLQEIYCNEYALRYVLFNIIENSIEGINRNKGTNYYGRIDIIIENLDDNFISINIEDNAGGMKKGEIDRIFDLFYTTKKSKSGLGLPTCKVVVEDILFGSIKAKNIDDGIKIEIKIAKN